MKTLVIVPAYNEEESLPGVIRDLRENIRLADILVVNDGSKDATARIAQEAGVAVLNLPFNLGIGGAMQAGYLYAEQRGYDIAVQCGRIAGQRPGSNVLYRWAVHGAGSGGGFRRPDPNCP